MPTRVLVHIYNKTAIMYRTNKYDNNILVCDFEPNQYDFGTILTVDLNRSEALEATVPFWNLILGEMAEYMRDPSRPVRSIDLCLLQNRTQNWSHNIHQALSNKVGYKNGKSIKKHEAIELQK